MNVLMLCPQFRPLVGGYERAAERLSAALAARGHVVVVLTERRDFAWSSDELVSGFRIHRFWCWYKRGWHGVTASASLGLWLLWHGRSFDVWHVHQYGAQASVAIVIGKLLRRPVVLKLTSSGAEQGLAVSLSALRLARWHQWVHRRVAACIAVSLESAAEAEAFSIPATRVHHIGNGVDTELLQPASTVQRAQAREMLRLTTSFLAVAVGRLAEEKNPLGALAAWQLALPALPPSALLAWVGEGPMRALVESRSRELQVRDRVILVGHSDEVSKWMLAADLFLLPSRNEGMANTLLEAMACGLPSVATAVSGVPQLLKTTGAGRVVPAGDMAAFADAIISLALNADERVRMGRRAREVIAADYSIERIAGRIEAVYERISNKT